MGYFSTIYTDNLPHRAKAVYMYLRDRANEKGACWPGINRIASDLDMSRSTVKRALGDLIQSGYIEKELRYRGIASTITAIRTQTTAATDIARKR